MEPRIRLLRLVEEVLLIKLDTALPLVTVCCLAFAC